MWLVSGAGVAGAAVALAAAGMVSASANADRGAVPEHVNLETLSTPAGRADALPAPMLRADFQSRRSYDLDSARLLGESDLGTYWTVLRDDSDKVCFVTELPDGIIGIGCQRSDVFNKSGYVLQVASTTYASELYVLPDGYEAGSSTVRSVASNTFEADPLARSSARTSAATSAGVTFESDSGSPITLSGDAKFGLVPPE